MTVRESAPAWFQQDLARELPEAVRAEGIRIWDSAGREYIDACSGAISVMSVGHGAAEVVDAIAEQGRQLAYVHSTQFRHPRGEGLASEIVRRAPASLNHVCFYTGGSEAVEAPVKLARQYHLLQGRKSRYLVLSRRRSYHGATLFALGVGGVPPARLRTRPTCRRLDPALSATRRLHRLARARGLMIYPGAGGDGVVGDQFLVSPPLTVTNEDVDLILDRLALALADLHAELGQ
jgi:adenosylmethionine-8-amino-7-oxononanoate aminotransferase